MQKQWRSANAWKCHGCRSAEFKVFGLQFVKEARSDYILGFGEKREMIGGFGR